MGTDFVTFLSRDEAIEKFREMWSWMANESERCKRKIHKGEYFIHLGNDPTDIYRQCFLCDYALDQTLGLGTDEYDNLCDFCPIDFGGIEGSANCYCCCDGSPYDYWEGTWTRDWESAAAFAQMVAELPEKERDCL